jgi:hypothetical protein
MGASPQGKTIEDFLKGKSDHTIYLFHYLINEYQKLGMITLHPRKKMIGISNGKKKIAWITQLGKNFIHIVFPFKASYPDNLCFQRIAQVPGHSHQFNHHFRLLHADDVNDEVISFMKMAMNED